MVALVQAVGASRAERVGARGSVRLAAECAGIRGIGHFARVSAGAHSALRASGLPYMPWGVVDSMASRHRLWLEASISLCES